MRKIITSSVIGLVLLAGTTGCVASKRQIDEDKTGSFQIQGTSWYGFCQGPNAFIWVPSYNDSDPDELEAVIYDDYRCVSASKGPDINPSSKPNTDPDGILDDED